MLTWKLHPRDAEMQVVLTGKITEHTPLAPLGAAIPVGRVVLDLAGIQGINSLGCREWLSLMRLLEQKGVDVVLDRCSVPIVHQLLMIFGFEGKGTVRSVHAPYLCRACGADHERLISLEADLEPGALESEICSRCGAVAELDDLPENYGRLASLLSRQGSGASEEGDRAEDEAG